MKKLCILLLFLLTVPVYSADKMRIAVLDLNPVGISSSLSGEVSEMVRDEFINCGKFIVIERNQMDSILKEQQFVQTGCTDSTCAVKIGKLLSAKKIMIGKFSGDGGKFRLSLRIIDVEKGIAEYSARDKASSEDLLEQAVSRLTKKMIARIEGKAIDESEFKEIQTVKMDDSERMNNGLKAMAVSAIPGLGQVLYGDDFALIEGAFFFVGTVALGYFTYASYTDMQDKEDTYNSLAPNLSQSVYTSKWDDTEKAKSKFKIFSIVTIGFYVVNFVDAFFAGKRPDTKIVLSKSGVPEQKQDGFYALFNQNGVFDDDKNISVGYRCKF